GVNGRARPLRRPRAGDGDLLPPRVQRGRDVGAPIPPRPGGREEARGGGEGEGPEDRPPDPEGVLGNRRPHRGRRADHRRRLGGAHRGHAEDRRRDRAHLRRAAAPAALDDRGDPTAPLRGASICIRMRALVLCGLAPVLFAFLPASAQEREAPPRLPEIRVIPPSAPGALPPSSPPSRVDTLTAPEIRRDVPSVLPEALERLPGVSLQSEQGNRLQPDLSLRGFTISPVTGLPPGLSVFLDGVRLNEPTVEEVNFDLIPLEDVERVDVVRGPSVLFGRNTLGGAINLVTRRGQEVREIVPEVAAGSFGRRDYRLRLGGSARPLDYPLSLTESLEDGFRDFAATRVSRVFGKLGVATGGTDATLSYQSRHDVRSRTFEESSEGRQLEADLTDLQHAVGVWLQDSITLVRDLFVPGSTMVVTVAGRWDYLRHDIDDRLGGPSSGVHQFNRFN